MINEIETFTGRFVNTKWPDPKTIVLEDIAHALANTCRFGGHTKTFYSVAEHAVLVSRRVEEVFDIRWLAMAALHHDDAEAYLLDVPRPMKPLLEPEYAHLTKRMNRAICESTVNAGPPWFYPKDFNSTRIRYADNWALSVEAYELMFSQGANWQNPVEYIETPDYWQGGLTPTEAEGLYLSRHWELVSAIPEDKPKPVLPDFPEYFPRYHGMYDANNPSNA